MKEKKLITVSWDDTNKKESEEEVITVDNITTAPLPVEEELTEDYLITVDELIEQMEDVQRSEFEEHINSFLRKELEKALEKPPFAYEIKDKCVRMKELYKRYRLLEDKESEEAKKIISEITILSDTLYGFSPDKDLLSYALLYDEGDETECELLKNEEAKQYEEIISLLISLQTKVDEEFQENYKNPHYKKRVFYTDYILSAMRMILDLVFDNKQLVIDSDPFNFYIIPNVLHIKEMLSSDFSREGITKFNDLAKEIISNIGEFIIRVL